MLFVCAIGTILVGMALLYMKHIELGRLDSAPVEEASIVDGRLQLHKGGRSTAISVIDSSGTEVIHCYIGHCGYEGIRDDFGKSARIWILDGKVAQIQIDGNLKLTKDEVVERLSNRTSPYFGIGLGLLLGIFGFNASRSSKEAD